MGALNIAIEIAAKDSGASALINSIKGGLGSLGDLAGGALTLGLGAAAAGIAGLGAGLGLAISEAMGAQEVMSQTEAVIASTGGAAGMTADAIADLAGSLSQNSRFADDAIQEGENLLLTFTNIGSDVFPMATQAMVDMATAMGTDAKSGAIQLGKALNDPVAGISALSRVGVSFTDDQKKMIEQMVKAGDVAGAQKIILAELNKEFGGSAAASAATFAGKLDVIKNQALNVAEAIGGPLITIGSQLIDQFLTPAMPLVTGIGNALTDFLAGVMGQTDPSERFLSLWEDVNDLFGNEDLSNAVTGVAEAIAYVFDSIGQGKDAGQILAGLADFSWDDFLPPGIASLINQTIKGAQTLGKAFSTAWESLSTIDLSPLTGAFQRFVDALNIQLPPAGDVVTSVATFITDAATNIATFFNTVLVPALVVVIDWVSVNLVPVLQDLGAWLGTNIPIAIQAVSDFWTTTLLPAITSVWEWMNGTLFPTLSELWTWLSTTITAALQSASDMWTGTLLPAITSVQSWIDTTLMPLLTSLNDLFAVTLDVTLKAAAGLWETTLLPAITKVHDFFDQHILPVLTSIADYIKVTFQPVFETLSSWFDTTLSATLSTISSAWGGLSDTIKSITDKVNDLKNALANMTLPSWLTPGSPTPFEIGLWGIGKAMDNLNDRGLPQLNVGFGSLASNSPLAEGIGAGGSFGQSIVVNVDARGANDPAAIKRAAKDGVREALREAGINADQRARVKS